MSNHKHAQFQLRLPDDLKQWLKTQAELNCRSVTAEIIFHLTQAKLNQEKKTD